ncbi:peroxiredoxin [Rhizobium sp. ERR 922]|uniref:peroxiredoxin n=1 Tax=unclassified Rhizobium TaxID=2613769 RepID=UPI0011AAF47D|nr:MULTISPECIES: peroxiredoxin [unclassified Rhizobium]TWB55453.1 peroxiredoxin [Rhizobium sp. ERR 922]TWB97213.1 peroxiredoxin [Rhizobium sp. ERR 942]
MTIAIGDTLPAATFKEKTADGPVEISTEQLFAGKRVVLFAVPGAFTPTCSLNHLPGFLENRDAILAKGVDDIAVVSINDWHVMGAWAQSSGGLGKIHFLADWDGSFTKALGLEADLSAGGLGIRSKRYSMLVENGVVKTLNIEESPGQATVSGAAAMMEQL